MSDDTVWRLREALRGLLEAVTDAMESPEEAASWAESGDMTGYIKSARAALLATERSQERVRVVWSEGPEARVRAALAHLRMLEAHCPCGHRPETPQTHPHAPGCAVYQAIRLLDGEHATQQTEQAAAAAWDVDQLNTIGSVANCPCCDPECPYNGGPAPYCPEYGLGG